MLSSKVGKSIYIGLNVYQYSTQILRSLDLSCLNQYVNGVGVYMMGRISGELMCRSLGLSENGLCVRALCDNRILDLGYVSLCCDIGVVGVKVGIIL